MIVWRTPSLGMRCGEAKPASGCLMVRTPSDWANGSHCGLSNLGLPSLKGSQAEGWVPRSPHQDGGTPNLPFDRYKGMITRSDSSLTAYATRRRRNRRRSASVVPPHTP